jgi:hypothetical protein
MRMVRAPADEARQWTIGNWEMNGKVDKEMFQRVRQYGLIDVNGRWYRPRAYGDPQPGGTWDGWLVFFPVGGGTAIATDRETTQATFGALTVWAAGLTPVYLDGALVRALKLAQQPSVIDQLEDAEYEALEDAERLETAAEIERATATVDEMAAAEARADAERLRRERLVTESALATTEEVAATEAAEIHEEAAREARAVAADAARRSRHAHGDATRTARPKKPRSAKKK